MNKFLLLTLLAALSSCRKEENEEAKYYANWESGFLSQGKYDQGGWMYGYPRQSTYRVRIDSTTAYEGMNAALLESESISDSSKGFGAVTTYIDPDLVMAKKIKLTCYAKTENVEGWAGIWYRVDKPYVATEEKSLGSKIFEGIEDFVGDNSNERFWAFDNMNDNPIRGTTDWKQYEFTFDVPQQTGAVLIGALLVGKGKLWVDHYSYEVIGSLPTDSTYQDKSLYLSKPPHFGFELY